MISYEYDPKVPDEGTRKNSSQASICSRLHRLKMDSEESCCAVESLMDTTVGMDKNEKFVV